MSPEELQKHSKVIDESVAWIEKRTDDIWNRYEEIGDCATNQCEEEKMSLMVEMDGYIGIVGAETPALRRIVNDINIKRRAVYSEKAQAARATLEEYAFAAGCQAILKTEPGEKYQAPDGSWATRGAGVPQRDARCP